MLRKIVNSDRVTFLHKWSVSNPTTLHADILAKEVYAPCDSAVIYIGRDSDNYYSVLIQICADVVVNLKHLATVSVKVGDLVKADSLIGVAKKFCRVELGTLSQDEVTECIRIYSRVYYKRNPEQLTAENLGFVHFNHGETEYAYRDSELNDITTLTKEQQNEYSQIEVQEADE